MTPLSMNRDRLFGLPLALRAHSAWTYASLVRHVPNWGRMLDAKNQLERFAVDPHPLVRRIATDLMPCNDDKECA